MKDTQSGGNLVRPFPQVGPLMHEAYEDLRHAEGADSLALPHYLGPIEEMPRPWDVTTCTPAELRQEVWAWLDAIVDWLNTEYVWASEDQIPGCWPLHPHLVHEIGVVADQRRRAGATLSSELQEEWHRYCLPAFFERLRARTEGACETGHSGPPGVGRTARYRSDSERERRQSWYRSDVTATAVSDVRPRPTPRLMVADGLIVDPCTGEVQ